MASTPTREQPEGPHPAAMAPATPRITSTEAEAPDRQPAGQGRYVQPPTDGEIASIRKLIVKTGRPEGITALSWSKPDKSLDRLLYEPPIEIARALRPAGEMVACAFCSDGHPKTLRPYLLWTADGHLRLVGPTCGPKYFGVAEFREMQRAARAKQVKSANIDLLLNHLGSAHLWRDEAMALAEFCSRFESVRRNFFRRVPSLHQRLRHEAREHGNALVVHVPVSGDAPTGFRSSTTGEASMVEPRTIAVLQGAEFLAPSFNAKAKAEGIVALIDGLAAPYKLPLSDDQILDLVGYMDDAALTRTTKALRGVHDNARRLHDWLQHARMFLSTETVEALDAWSSHEKNDFNLRVTRIPGLPTAVAYRCGVESIRLPLADQFVVPVMQNLGTVSA